MMDDGDVPAEAFDAALGASAENLYFGSVLVHCALWASRSVVVVALHLALTKGISFETALQRVEAFRDEGVELPFPQRDIHLRSISEPLSAMMIAKNLAE